MGAIENMNKRIAKNQAAQAFGISVDTLNRRIKDGMISLKFHKDGQQRQSRAYCWQSALKTRKGTREKIAAALGIKTAQLDF